MNFFFDPSTFQIESSLVGTLNQFTHFIETNPNMMNYPINPVLSTFCMILDTPRNEDILFATLKCILALVTKSPNYCFQIIDMGIYIKLLFYMSPGGANSIVSLNIAITVRNIIMQMGNHNVVFTNSKFNYLTFGLFLDKIFEFPLSEQKSIISFTKKLSGLYLFDINLPSIIEACPLLTHIDIKIVADTIQILVNYIQKAGLSALKVVDPQISHYISIGLHIINDDHLIGHLLTLLSKLVCVSYEHADYLIKLPIDFGLIIQKLSPNPRTSDINFIIKIIKQIFTYKTLRESDTRKEEITKFAYYVQPVLIQIINSNLGDVSTALDCLLITFDVYFPLSEVNDIIDSIVQIINIGNRQIKIGSLYKKIIENSKVKDGMNQYNSLNILKPNLNSLHFNDMKSFVEIGTIHASSFVLSEPLQNAILSFLKNISSSQIIEQTLSNSDYQLFQKSLLNVVKICQKMIVFNTPKNNSALGSTLLNGGQAKQVNFTLYNTSGNWLNLVVPNFLPLLICETYFNFIHGANQGTFSHPPNAAFDHFKKVIALNKFKKYIDLDQIDDLKLSVLNHVLCYKLNEMIHLSRTINSSLMPTQFNALIGSGTPEFRFYKIRAQGKIYSVFDNIQDVMKQVETTQFEMLNVPKYGNGLREADFICRSDIKHHTSISQIDFKRFHESFISAYPTIYLQKRAFDYMPLNGNPRIEANLQMLREIRRLFPDLSNDDVLKKNVFENDVFASRLLENINLKTNINPTISSSFIKYPFVFSLESRITFLKITSMTFVHSLFTIANDIFIKSNKPSTPLIRLNLSINRNNIYDDGMVVFNLLSPGGLSFVVKFTGENGMGSGPTQEFFRLFALQLQKNSHDIWLTDISSEKVDSQDKTEYEEFDLAHRFGESGLFPSPFAVKRPDLFFTLGALCAKAIEMGIALPIHFSPSFFKLIRGEKIGIEEVSKQYSNILNLEDKSAIIGFIFTVPGRPDIELRNGGSHIVTEEENVDLYIELLKRVLTFDVHIANKEEKGEKEGNEASPLASKSSSSAWGPLQRVMSSTISPPDPIHLESQNAPISSIASSPVHQNQQQQQQQANSPSTDQPNEDNIANSSSSSSNDLEIPADIKNFIERYSFGCCASMFKEGFGRIIPWSAMNLFTAEEICLLIEGEVDLSLDNLHKYVEIGIGFNFDSPMIIWLFEILSGELSAREKKLFARFVTGCDSFGAFGLKSLRPYLSITKTGKSEDSLPSASTCTNCLKLPEYSTKELLKKKLLYALYECNETFYLS